jgi:hypothetical protein
LKIPLLPSPNPLHLCKKIQQLLKRKVRITKLRGVALLFEGDDVAGEDRPKFCRPVFGAAAAEKLGDLLTIGQQYRIRDFGSVCLCVHFIGFRSVWQNLPLRFS